MEINLPKEEEKILKFWKEKKIFEKSLEKTKNLPRFVFYEGPPFANGLPGIHHLLSRAFKDIILRYKTMQGFFVERKAGWDTHGLPTEMEAEKKLGIKTKKEIEKLGIEKFIEECKNNVFTYKKEWEDFTERIGFWLDLKNAYITCSNDYIESLWWILKRIWEKGFLYQDYKVSPYCPRCQTVLSSHEVAQGYAKIKEPVIYVKFEMLNSKSQANPKSKTQELKTFFLIWTTTPWTLPGNVAIAINPDFAYAKIRVGKEYLILAKERIEACKIDGEIVQEFSGKELIGLEYQPLFSPKDLLSSNIFKIIPGNFVSKEEGTGLVHIAPAFGEEDLEAIKMENEKRKRQNEPEFPILITVDEEGKMVTPGYKWSKMFVKEADPLIIEDLKKRNLLFKEEIYEHDYPFCWRCDSPLLYYIKESWFINMQKVKKDLIENNQKINWVPEYLKEGRFGEWLREVKDWNLSRERYWGTPMPFWVCQTGKEQKQKTKNQKSCDNIKVISSIEELEEMSGQKVKELHRPFIDEIVFKCEKCKGLMKRIPEVIDCWFDSGSMPFAQWHYPFENKERIDKGEFFPADFICEGIDQTRGWFYTLLAVSTLLSLGNPYKNVISHGLVLDAKGQKMSKSRRNIVRPQEVIDRYGADVARFYFYTINPVAEPKRFDFKDVETLYRKFFDTLINSQKFFLTYLDEDFQPIENFQPENLLDRWIFSKFQDLNFLVIKKLENFDVVSAARLFLDFVDDLSNWYIRRSRKRFQRPESKKEKNEASQTLYSLLLGFSKLLAPFCPFISEKLYQELPGKKEESVHLNSYPQPEENLIDKDLEERIEKTREIVALSLAERVKFKIKVRQPLAKLEIKEKLEEDLLDLIKEEVNVKEIFFNENLENKIKLDTKITLELKEEGVVREIVRQVQEMRKRAFLTPKDRISIKYFGSFHLEEILEKNRDFILGETLAKNLEKISKEKAIFDSEKEIDFEEEKLWLGIKKI